MPKLTFVIAQLHGKSRLIGSHRYFSTSSPPRPHLIPYLLTQSYSAAPLLPYSSGFCSASLLYSSEVNLKLYSSSTTESPRFLYPRFLYSSNLSAFSSDAWKGKETPVNEKGEEELTGEALTEAVVAGNGEAVEAGNGEEKEEKEGGEEEESTEEKNKSNGEEKEEKEGESTEEKKKSNGEEKEEKEGESTEEKKKSNGEEKDEKEGGEEESSTEEKKKRWLMNFIALMIKSIVSIEALAGALAGKVKDIVWVLVLWIGRILMDTPAITTMLAAVKMIA